MAIGSLANQCWNIYGGILGVLIILHSGYLQHSSKANAIIDGRQRVIVAGLVHFILIGVLLFTECICVFVYLCI